MTTALTNATIYFIKDGKRQRYTSTWKEYVDCYKEEIKERYGADVKIEVEYR